MRINKLEAMYGRSHQSVKVQPRSISYIASITQRWKSTLRIILER